MSNAAAAMARSGWENAILKLVRFFPTATPVRIPIRLTRITGPGNNVSENTVIEFGTAREVLFFSSLKLEFGDTLSLHNSDGTLDTQACVVALQYDRDVLVVAARFKQAVTNWIVKQ